MTGDFYINEILVCHIMAGYAGTNIVTYCTIFLPIKFDFSMFLKKFFFKRSNMELVIFKDTNSFFSTYLSWLIKTVTVFPKGTLLPSYLVVEDTTGT